MKLVHAGFLTIAVFLVLLLLSAFILQDQTGTLLETKENALLTKLRDSQFGDGSFPDFMFSNLTAGGSQSTSFALQVVESLNNAGAIDITKAISYMVVRQNETVGNQTSWGWPAFLFGSADEVLITELFSIYEGTHVMKSFHAIDLLNRSAIIDLVLARYDESEGTFHEPIINYTDESSSQKQITACSFPLDFHSYSDIAYADSNIVSTFLGVSILADLNSLQLINTTRTMEWILSCKAENGGFKPFPASVAEYLPGWSSLSTNPFYVDEYGTGIAYTYAALGAMRALNVSIKDTVDTQKTKEYVLSCQESYPRNTTRFLAFPGDSDTPDFSLTYYAIMTLDYLGAIQEEVDIASRVASYTLNWLFDPYLEYENTWPIPTRTADRRYGLFQAFFPLTTTAFSVAILNVTNNLGLLDQYTPIVFATWTSIVLFSAEIAGFTAVLAFLGTWIRDALKKRNQQKTDQILQVSRAQS